MQELAYRQFACACQNKGALEATLNLTYRCNLKCVHCFTCDHGKPLVSLRELGFGRWKKILDDIRSGGCLWLTFSGGEPLLHKDFPAIYRYALKKGFLVTVFTNATLINNELLDLFRQHPPFAVEVSLYGSSAATHESVTGVGGSFNKSVTALGALKKAGIPAVVKCIGLKHNKDDVLRLKAFSEKLLGKGRFKFDAFVFPRLNRDKTPCLWRLEPKEIISIEEKDAQMCKQLLESSHQIRKRSRPGRFLYFCNSWQYSFFLTPDGRLQFCNISSKRSSSLLKTGFKRAFYKKLAGLSQEVFRKASKCSGCRLRVYCSWCPERAYLETADNHAPVPYYCRLAKARKRQLSGLDLKG